ncbi:MAG: hypothetical protein DRQ49_02005 [Gammaproteobacteria bacterium]|nr:MAG: hypothetical protein DRQ49_02005 [Gammaproteobacteria bacterium]RKZ76803.1 MAG: hypothetical protein DRQ57_02560 [Gammaproteobacteria bacterium]
MTTNQQTEKNTDKSAKPINIRDIERLVLQQNFEEASALIIKLLVSAERKGGVVLDGKSDLEHDFLSEYTRLASAMTAFFAHPKMVLFFDGFTIFATYKKHLLGIFQLSGFRGTDHLLALIGNQEGKGDQFSVQGEQQMMKFLLFYSFDSEVDIDFAHLLKNIPKLAMPVYLSLVGEECLLTHSACQRRDKLLEVGPLLEEMPLEDKQLTRLSNLWMFCSYSESKTKHDIKAHLNVVLRKFMEKQGVNVPALPAQRRKKDRPVILIPSERFTASHAMYRCYAPAIQQLREKFELVFMSETHRMDDISKTLFDKVIEVDFGKMPPKKLVGKVLKLKPDMIYFPSLGMSQWTLLLANLRLAPIQFMTLGHPATSHSPFIDYILMVEVNYSPNVDCFSEKVVLLDTANFHQMIAPAGAVAIPPDIRKNPSAVRLAITSTSFKLNASFMAVCQRIWQNSQKPVEFHFFPSEKGMSYQKVKQRILEWIPEAKVYPGANYNIYIANLNACDIHLSPFPFGGTNSNVDSMQHGIPIVTLEGDEPHARTDLPFFEMSNLPKWLWTHSEDEYVEAALRLVHHDEERVAIGEALLAQDFESILRDHEFCHHEKVFGKTVEWLYQHHEAIQKDGRKVWDVEAQKLLLPT